MKKKKTDLEIIEQLSEELEMGIKRVENGRAHFNINAYKVNKTGHVTELSLNQTAIGKEIQEFPHKITELRYLEELSLYFFHFPQIPPEISNLSRLRFLCIHNNRVLKKLPLDLSKLEFLETLNLDLTRLTEPPPEILDQGSKAILSYLREKFENEVEIWESRLMVVGEGGVGKTQLLRALNEEAYQVDSETTHGIGITPLVLPHPYKEGVTMKLNAWDFGGQEIYHATHQFFLASRSLFLLVWNSRLGWEQGKLHYWLDTIKALAPGAPVMLVATHIDEREANLPFEDLQDKYPQIISKWSVSNSQRDIGDGIDALRNALQDVAADKEKMPLMGEKIPASFWKVTQAIRALKAQNKWTTVDRLWEIMDENSVSESARPVLAQQLHDLGELLHFRDDEKLKDTVLMDAEFVTTKISNVLEYKGIEDGLGIFTREHMRECWMGLDYWLQDRLLRLMERFDLSYEIPDDPEDRSLIVERLSLDPIPFADLWNTLHPESGFREIRMKFDPQSTRPPGIPGWFIARSHRFTTHTHWKYGALFQDNRKQRRHLALLETSSQYRYVKLTVRGPNPQAFFTILRDGLELTFARYPGLELKRTIPCPGRKRSNPSEPCDHEFDVSDLENRMQLSPPKLTIECPKCYDDISVSKLLFGLHWTTDSEVLNRLDELDRSSQERTQQIIEELGDLRELSQRQFLTLFNAEQRLEESHCPRVFSLRPQKGKSWSVGRLFAKKWILQLYCEAPGNWHPCGAKSGRYTIKEPERWTHTVTPWTKRLITVLKYSAHFAGPVLGYTAEELSKLLEEEIALMEALIEKLPDVKLPQDQISDHSIRKGDRSLYAVESLRSLRILLKELDPKEQWGGLRKTLTPEGHWLWLCEEHAQFYQQ